MTIVLDASLALSWCFEDERRDETIEIGRRILIEGATVPNLFHLEVANTLLLAERRERISRQEIAERLDTIAAMPIVVDADTMEAAWEAILPLARSEQLTAYDAAYLELALRLGAEIATLDAALAAAARRRGLIVLPRDRTD